MLEVLSFVSIIVFALLGTPLFIIMALAALTAFFFSEVELSAVAIEIYKISSQATILTIPLFTFAGYMMAESGSPKRLLRLADAALGWLPGGVAIVSLVICAFFTAFTGASSESKPRSTQSAAMSLAMLQWGVASSITTSRPVFSRVARMAASSRG